MLLLTLSIAYFLIYFRFITHSKNLYIFFIICISLVCVITFLRAYTSRCNCLQPRYVLSRDSMVSHSISFFDASGNLESHSASSRESIDCSMLGRPIMFSSLSLVMVCRDYVKGAVARQYHLPGRVYVYP